MASLLERTYAWFTGKDRKDDSDSKQSLWDTLVKVLMKQTPKDVIQLVFDYSFDEQELYVLCEQQGENKLLKLTLNPTRLPPPPIQQRTRSSSLFACAPPPIPQQRLRSASLLSPRVMPETLRVQTTVGPWNQDLPPIRETRGFAPVVFNKQIFILGGVDSKKNEVLNLDVSQKSRKLSWIDKPPLPHPRAHFGACAYQDQIWLIGGITNDVADPTVDLYDPHTQAWSMLPAFLNVPRWSHTCCVVGGKLYVLGGTSGRPSAPKSLTSCEVYDPRDNKWRLIKPMRSQRSYFCVCAVEQYKSIFIFGGLDIAASDLLTCEVYDTIHDTWKSLPNLPGDGTSRSTAFYYDHAIFLLNIEKDHYRFDLKTFTWSLVQTIPRLEDIWECRAAFVV